MLHMKYGGDTLILPQTEVTSCAFEDREHNYAIG